MSPREILWRMRAFLRDQVDRLLVGPAGDDVVMGCVSPLNDQGAVIPKIALLMSSWEQTVAGVQLSRFCASGLEAVNLAAMKVASGWEDLVVAGGVESMSRAPMGSDGGAWSDDPETNPHLFRFTDGDPGDQANPIRRAASRLEARFVTVYRQGAFDPEQFLLQSWKRTPTIQWFLLTFEGEGRILSERITAR